MAALSNSTTLLTNAQEHLYQSISSNLQSCNTLKQAKQIHACILRNTLSENLYAKLLLFYTSSPDSLDYALRVFQQQQEPTIFMWNTLIRGYPNSPSPVCAIALYTSMRERGMQPNNYTFTFLVKSCTTRNSIGPQVHAQIIVFGIPDTDVHVYTSLVNMYASSTTDQGNNVEAARRLFDRMKYRTAVTWNSMIAGYTRTGDITFARKLFNEMPDKNKNDMACGYTRLSKFDASGRLFNHMPMKTLPTWNAMIAGYTQASRSDEALALFHQMQLAGVMPNEITIVSVLPSCARLGTLELGEWIHLYATRNKMEGNVAICNAIIDMYAKCGCINKAEAVFRNMKGPSLVSWNTLISGFATNGRAEEAIQLFTEMETKRVIPDDITFVGLLNACAHAGFVETSWKYFQRMQTIYGIKPKIEHYGCMVDVLGRTRRLDEALNLIDQMPMEPNSVVLGSLLSACTICNDAHLGEKVLEKLMQIEPSNTGYYVLLSNLYASLGRWEDVSRVRNLMKSRGIEKTPGCSSIELNNTIHEFVVGDKTHPQTQKIYRKLSEVYQRLESAGYMPDTSAVLFDLDEEEKTQNLTVHSEKLAVAFGLLNTSTAKPIRVMKNLRVCRDCHEAIKLISQLYSREIVLRDCNRFHHFKDGDCSCKDFW